MKKISYQISFKNVSNNCKKLFLKKFLPNCGLFMFPQVKPQLSLSHKKFLVLETHLTVV